MVFVNQSRGRELILPIIIGVLLIPPKEQNAHDIKVEGVMFEDGYCDLEDLKDCVAYEMHEARKSTNN